jgi:hypothetical protein
MFGHNAQGRYDISLLVMKIFLILRISCTLDKMLLDKMDMKELHIMATVSLQIWIRRNKFIFEGQFVAPWVVIRIAKEQGSSF